MAHTYRLYKRKDGKFDWRARAENGEIIATSGGQGYENKKDCMAGFISHRQDMRAENAVLEEAKDAD